MTLLPDLSLMIVTEDNSSYKPRTRQRAGRRRESSAHSSAAVDDIRLLVRLENAFNLLFRAGRFEPDALRKQVGDDPQRHQQRGPKNGE